MLASVVIRSKDEADRLRLTLASLATQTEKPEVVVVNDGSSDHTREVIAEAEGENELAVIHHTEVTGRSEAANAGAARATGEVLIFIDGDTLAAPDLVERHMERHRRSSNLVVRGETWHLRCTRPFLNPETGTPWPGGESRVARMPENEKARSVVSRQTIRQDFASIESRAQPGIYPGFGPRKLLELEMHALYTDPDGNALWAAASGSNQSVNRIAFLEAGGFHRDLTINEHREIALRLCARGLRMAPTSARTYHMIHRSGWRDPMLDTAWEQIFYDAHPIPEVALLPFFWASLSEAPPFPAQACLGSLAELAAAADGYRDIVGLKSVREAHLRFRMERAVPADPNV
jgi:glycosyltransferase involved in cell wall biosynthesis